MPGLPPLDGCTRVEAARPSATVLAKLAERKKRHARAGRAAAGQRPHGGLHRRHHAEMAARPEGDGPGIALLAILGADGPLAGRPIGNRRGGANLSATLDKAYYEPEEGIRILATVRDKEGQAADNAKVTAKITGPGGKTVIGRPCARAGSRPAITMPFSIPTSPGAYQFEVSAKLGDATLTTDKLAAEVGRQNLEFEKLDLDDKLLARLAAYTKGRYLHISSADLLLDQLDRSQRNRSEFSEGKLYNPPLFWTLFVGILSLEWILRKKYQLR